MADTLAAWADWWLASTQPARMGRSTRRLLHLVVGLVVLSLGARLGHGLGHEAGMASLRADADHRLQLFAASVEGTVQRLDHIPSTVQINDPVLDLLRSPGDTRLVREVDILLGRLNANVGSMALFVLDDRGTVLASSNRGLHGDSAVGANMSFRPYFVEALAGRAHRHFAIGVNDDQPGLFVSHPIRDGLRVVGVAAVQISLQPIARTWHLLGVPALLVDANGVAILSSEPDWLYTAMTELSLETRLDVQANRLYAQQRVRPFGLTLGVAGAADGLVVHGALPEGAPGAARHPDTVTWVVSRPLDGTDWELVTFWDMGGVRQQAGTWAAMGAIGTGFCLLLWLYLGQRRRILEQRHASRRMLERINEDLEQKVQERMRDLTDVNDRLRLEMREREQAEQRLRTAQAELLHAAKMAVVGKLATSVTHELTQPLGAIRTLSGNALEFLKRGDPAPARDNLVRMTRLADQMGRIIQPLKAFAHKSQPVQRRCDVAQVVGSVLFLYEQRLRDEAVQVINGCTPDTAVAWCDPHRLEQVLINLVGNALDSMASTSRRVLALTAERMPADPGHDGDAHTAAAGWVRIAVLDTGAGIPDAVRAQLFEPFFTTKAAGAGLGLGLALSREIVREFHGTIDADNRPEGGACFSLRLPAAPEDRAGGPPSHEPNFASRELP